MVSPERSLREVLRDETKTIHREVDSAMQRHADVSAPRGYTRFLTIMDETIRVFAAHLDLASHSCGLDQRSEVLRRALQTDLDRTAYSPGSADCFASSATNVSFCGGVGYALEGSAMGAAVMLTQVSTALPGAPTAYLTLLANERVHRWSVLRAWLNSSTEIEVSQAISGASSVFSVVNQQVHLEKGVRLVD